MSIKEYLKNKKVYRFRGKSYYKAKNYTHSYYINAENIIALCGKTKEVMLEKNVKEKKIKGKVKWSTARKKLLISEGSVRTMEKPFEIE